MSATFVKQHEGDCCPLCLARVSDEDSWSLCCHLSELPETEIRRLRDAMNRAVTTSQSEGV